MTEKTMYWTTVVFSVIALLMFITNTSLMNKNREIQLKANERQATINQAASMTQLNQNLAQALAELSIKNNDKEIKSLLESQGITVTKPEKNSKDASTIAPEKKNKDMKENGDDE